MRLSRRGRFGSMAVGVAWIAVAEETSVSGAAAADDPAGGVLLPDLVASARDDDLSVSEAEARVHRVHWVSYGPPEARAGRSVRGHDHHHG